MNYTIKTFPSDSELARSAAEQWLKLVAEAGKKLATHSVALSGGRVTKILFNEIVEQSRMNKISLSPVHFYWADERCLPPDNDESNFKMANDLLFQPLGIPEEKIHRLRGEEQPAIAVGHANSDIFQNVARNLDGLPVLDLIFLGMGEDGHVASLFPHAPEDLVTPKGPFISVTNSPKPPPRRLSLTYAAIAAAREVWVLASGKGKTTALKESLADNGLTPLAKVLRSCSKVKILTDVQI